MRWLIFICFTIFTYVFLIFLNRYLSYHNLDLSSIHIYAAGSVITAIFFEWLCNSNICLPEEDKKERVLVDKQAYKSTLQCTMDYWNEIELKTDKIKELDKKLEKADKILRKTLEKTKNKQIKQLIKDYLNEKK